MGFFDGLAKKMDDMQKKQGELAYERVRRNSNILNNLDELETPALKALLRGARDRNDDYVADKVKQELKYRDEL